MGDISPSHLAKSAVAALTGAAFGAIILRSRVCEPDVVRDQTLMKRFVAIKWFFSAVITSMVVVNVMSLLRFTQDYIQQAQRCNCMHLSNKNVINMIIGGIIVGIGISFCGAIPETVSVLAGAASIKAWFIFLGGLVGTLFYSQVEPMINTALQQFGTNSELDMAPGLNFVWSFPLAAIMTGIVIVLEILFPWTNELQMTSVEKLSFSANTISPIIAGVAAGLLQIPVIIAFQDTFDPTSSLCTALAIVLPQRNSFLAGYRSGTSNWWQIIYLLGIFIGSQLASQYWRFSLWWTSIGIYNMIVGGFLMFFGSHFAGVGSMLSGLSFLSAKSVIFVASVFATSIVGAYVMPYLDLLGEFVMLLLTS